MKKAFTANRTSQIKQAFGGKLHVSKPLQRLVVQTLAKMPDNIVNHITSTCWFLGSVDDATAYTFRGDELVGKHLIILSDRLLAQSVPDIEYTIAHEIGHVVLGHRNSILAPQSKKEIVRQEREARQFAIKYISD